MSKSDELIKNKFIPLWIKNTKDLLLEALSDSNNDNLIEYLSQFEIECKKEREQIIQINDN